METKFIDLSHPIFHQMPGYQYKKPDGSIEKFTVDVRKVVERNETKSLYENNVEFLLSKVIMHTAIGTYLDVPYHRFENGKDISSFVLSDFIMDGIVIDLENNKSDLEIMTELDVRSASGKAVLFRFGMDKYWGKPEYTNFQSISEKIINKLVELEVKLIGVDTVNIDKFDNLHRPAHTQLLQNGILIVENLRNLHLLVEKKFRLFVVPINIKEVANFPIRAFAELLS